MKTFSLVDTFKLHGQRYYQCDKVLWVILERVRWAVGWVVELVAGVERTVQQPHSLPLPCQISFLL